MTVYPQPVAPVDLQQQLTRAVHEAMLKGRVMTQDLRQLSRVCEEEINLSLAEKIMQQSRVGFIDGSKVDQAFLATFAGALVRYGCLFMREQNAPETMVGRQYLLKPIKAQTKKFITDTANYLAGQIKPGATVPFMQAAIAVTAHHYGFSAEAVQNITALMVHKLKTHEVNAVFAGIQTAHLGSNVATMYLARLQESRALEISLVQMGEVMSFNINAMGQDMTNPIVPVMVSRSDRPRFGTLRMVGEIFSALRPAVKTPVIQPRREP